MFGCGPRGFTVEVAALVAGLALHLCHGAAVPARPVVFLEVREVRRAVAQLTRDGDGGGGGALFFSYCLAVPPFRPLAFRGVNMWEPCFMTFGARRPLRTSPPL